VLIHVIVVDNNNNNNNGCSFDFDKTVAMLNGTSPNKQSKQQQKPTKPL
jgi:hypothetical protein